MKYRRSAIEIESPEQYGYDRIDCNLAESSFTDGRFGQLGEGIEELLLQYGDHLGKPELRQILALDAGVGADDVLLTVGAAGALFIVASSLLEAGDEIVVCFPNYITNLETPRALGAQLRKLELRFESGYRMDMDELAGMVSPRTRLISLTTPHNPTGTVLSESELRQAVEIAESCGAWLLVDETYRGLSYVGTTPVAASLSPRAISVSSLSKTWGLPGLRLGWLVCTDPELKELLLAAKEQIHISTSVLDEEIAWRYLKDRDRHLKRIKGLIDQRFACLCNFMEGQSDLEWVKPEGGVIAFPRLREDIDVDRFYDLLNNEYGTFVGPGHWFEMDRRNMRVGYGWPEIAELERGLDNISKAAARARAQ
jgi:aspartate/methionine/tyrosine aminotransferase